ncbi:MAG TPA: O-antigen ligase family protein [Hymenobacter sp.]|uniref:O-antigen ligase family protein n=1 Tax=Hymenobacter sp. TaxID=1898978 RepID=UPI002D7F1610|nr:O-antigen ligase family protein [Hymenobacter sp.]HET9502408.1 O-antigen ligase family protein [Hymenobacter sp.]
MSILTTPKSHHRFLRTMSVLLTIIVLIKLAGFFTWNEDVGVTRVLKLVSRLAMTAAAYGTYRLIIKRGAVDSFRWHNSWSPLLYGAYLGLGLASLLWSRNPGYSLLQWLMDVETLVFAFYFVKCFLLLDEFFPGSPVRFYHVLGNATFLILSVFLVGMLIAPDVFYRLTHDGEEARLGGFIMNPNELGMLCAVGIACLLFNFYRRHRLAWTLVKIAALLLALVLTGSRSSLVGFLLIVFFHIQQAGNKRLKIGANLSVLLAVPALVPLVFIKQGGLEEVLSMTGRLPFWHALLTEGLPREPLLGYGFMRIAYGEYFQSVHTYAAQMAHNTFIQVLMNLGLVGFTIVMIQLGATIRGFIRTSSPQLRLTGVGLLIPILINSFTEFGIFGMTNYGILFYQFLICFVSLRFHALLTDREQLWLARRRPELAVV